jgi:hypothetical protein
MAIAMAFVVFLGFAPSYYLRSRFGLGPQLTPLLHLHGAVMTAWFALLIVQTTFIAAGRVLAPPPRYRRSCLCDAFCRATRLCLHHARPGRRAWPEIRPALQFWLYR